MSVASGSPLICVIVPTFDCESTLERALLSLAEQQWRDFEVIVSDGASRDGTLHVAHRHAGLLPALHVDSRADRGTYDAINRALALARGEWVLILGSDDRLHAPDTFARVAEHLRGTEADLVYGDVQVAGPRPLVGVPVGGRYAGPLSLARLCKRNLCQQSVFYRRALFDELGVFDLRYRLWADWDINLRAALRRPPLWIDVVVADYATGGQSSESVDPVFAAEVGLILQRELLARPHDRRLWPIQKRLLSLANALRKRGRWREAGLVLRQYVGLLRQRRRARADAA